MPDTEELKIPKAPDTMRATPQAIAHELEPHIDRVLARVLSEVNVMITPVLARLDKEGLTIASALHDLGEKLHNEHLVVVKHVLALEQKIVSITKTTRSMSAKLRAHDDRLKKQAAEIKRLAAAIATKKRKAKRAKERRAANA